MVANRVRRVVLLAAAVGFAVLAGGPVRAADDNKELREELLKLNSITDKDAQRDKLRALAKDKDKAKKLVTEAGKMLKEAKGKDNPFNFNGGLIVARLAHFNKQYDIAEPFYEALVENATKIKSGSKMVDAYEGLIDLYWETKKYALVSETCQKFVDDMGPEEYERAKPFILERLVQSMAKEGKFDEALGLVDNLIRVSAQADWYFLQTKGWVLREQGKLPAAIEAYNSALEKLDTTDALKGEGKDQMKDRVRYILTGLYVDNKDVDKAAKHLQTLIKRNPDNPTYKNDLGFIWCDANMNLEESEKLIKEAIELDTKEREKLKKEGKLDEVKPNAAYLDSLGWVLFKQKKYKEALEPLKQAAADDEDGSHLEIWDHLADCHMALGEKKEAIAAWEKALKCEDLTKRDGERRRKVSEKLKKARE
ncbi:photosystem I assembly protein Ycf3 [Gemmata obscuriglobus]|uniref:Tetratricopeptide repeat protein n=1 Tax=Gemmata obscuriglobus TaxID=114 RepID=A0A2Z3GZ18_9BACT|nr:tetratricopeptide repeat protein [Gemmata obscuriglobus]QEG31324.1 photosystem I assembly protein Ycf3 [Gemmata obscuriglobus]VTS10664.1 tetratricopeptide repeat protein : Tetratricopeptide TPR_2 repeat protein OS=Planctomyces limnophilus (strain ATCC 43296 / DSM 3776 / IFAM 1008 / 290) GN=Plim_2555 PE=4 SV=1: TPR_9: TPR_6: TPR_11 [Gemmata obscuriglobus UQM 2246]